MDEAAARGKTIFSVLKDAGQEWSKDKASRLGAALAYYTIFSIGPLLVIMLTVAGFVLGDAAEGQIVDQVEVAIGSPEGAAMIEGMVKSAGAEGAGLIGTVLGTVGLLLGALGLFGHLKEALNTIWEVEPPKRGILGAIVANFTSFVIVLFASLLMLAAVAASGVITFLSNFLEGGLPGGPLVWQLLNYAVTVGVLTVMFAVIFKFLPDVKIEWKDVWIGALVTAVLFLIGQVVISLYMAFANVGSTFGAAGGLVIVLVWIYYSAQIIFYGAEITQVYARQRGSHIVPKEGARRVTSAERAEQGMKPKEATRERERQESLKPSPWFSR